MCLIAVGSRNSGFLNRIEIGIARVFLGFKQGELPDGVASAQANPLGDRAVLALSLSKLLLGAEGLVALWEKVG